MKSDKQPKLSRWFGALSRRMTVAAFAALACMVAQPSYAQDKEVTIAYQQIVDPWVVAIASGSIEKETGYKINWRQFESGAKVATAMASGDVKVGVIGSSPLAAAVSQGLDLQHQTVRSEG
jgi:taurine transport system substrate-binding protein